MVRAIGAEKAVPSALTTTSPEARIDVVPVSDASALAAAREKATAISTGLGVFLILATVACASEREWASELIVTVPELITSVSCSTTVALT